jgi:hypothetical protein
LLADLTLAYHAKAGARERRIALALRTISTSPPPLAGGASVESKASVRATHTDASQSHELQGALVHAALSTCNDILAAKLAWKSKPL